MDRSPIAVSPILRERFRSVMRQKRKNSTIELRKNYREKMKEERDKIMDKLRPISNTEDLNLTISTILQDNLIQVCNNLITNDNEIDKPSFDIDEEINYEEELEKMLLEEQEKYILKCLEEQNENDQETIPVYKLLCPICKCGHFTEILSDIPAVKCTQCQIPIPTNLSIAQVTENVFQTVTSHAANCSNNPEFTIVPCNDKCNMLILLCSQCKFMCELL